MALTKKTKIKRLLQLADLLDRVPEERFNMSTWASNLPPSMDPAMEASCGTSACALGWATTLQFARKLGAGIVWRGGPSNAGRVETTSNDDPDEVAKELFGVSGDEKSELFYGPSCTPKAKAAQIRALCKRLQEGA